MQGPGRDKRSHPTFLPNPWSALFQKQARNLECDVGNDAAAPACVAKEILPRAPVGSGLPGGPAKRLIRRTGAGQSAGSSWVQRRLLLH